MSKKKATEEANVETAQATNEAETAIAESAVSENAEMAEGAKDESFCIYLGPTITRVIRNGKMFTGNKEAVLNELKDVTVKYPLVAEMVISCETLAEDRIKIKTPGNLLYVNYQKLAKSLRNGG